MRILKMFQGSVNERYVDETVRILEEGGLIIYPTDTMYAIGCDALNNRAIERICRIKGLDPKKNNLSILCGNISQASRYAKIDNDAFAILKEFLPGPFTFILPASPALPKVFKGRHNVGIRIPDSTIPQAIAEALGRPLLTTSVPTSPEQELILPEELADIYSGEGVSLVVDGGEGNVEFSTIVDLTDSGAPEILRQGKGVFEK